MVFVRVVCLVGELRMDGCGAYLLEHGGRRYAGASRDGAVRKVRHADGLGSAFLGPGAAELLRWIPSPDWEEALVDEAILASGGWSDRRRDRDLMRGGPFPGLRIYGREWSGEVAALVELYRSTRSEQAFREALWRLRAGTYASAKREKLPKTWLHLHGCCWHCKAEGHYRAECPSRTPAALPPSKTPATKKPSQKMPKPKPVQKKKQAQKETQKKPKKLGRPPKKRTKAQKKAARALAQKKYKATAKGGKARKKHMKTAKYKKALARAAKKYGQTARGKAKRATARAKYNAEQED